MMRLHLPGAAALAAVISMHTPAQAQDVPTFRLTLKGDCFEPAELRVPAGVHFVLIVKNESAAAAGFESKELNAGKVIPIGREATIPVGPLTAGRYPFGNELDNVAAGAVIAA